MECFEAKELVSEYINRTLPPLKLEEFVVHVRNCPSCYDELETYFIVDEVMNQLSDEDQETTLDFKELLEQDLKRSERYIMFDRLKIVVFILGVFLLALVILYLAYLAFSI